MPHALLRCYDDDDAPRDCEDLRMDPALPQSTYYMCLLSMLQLLQYVRYYRFTILPMLMLPYVFHVLLRARR